MCAQSELTPAGVHEFLHGFVMDDARRSAMETAMRSLARPDAAECIARAIAAE